MFEVDYTIQEKDDLFYSLHYTNFVFGLNVSCFFEGRNEWARIFGTKGLSQPVYILAFSYDWIAGEVGDKSDLKFIFGSDSEKKTTWFFNLPCFVVNLRIWFKLEYLLDLTALLLRVYLVVPKIVLIVIHFILSSEVGHNFAGHNFLRRSGLGELFFSTVDFFLQGLFKILYHFLQFRQTPVFQVDIFTWIASHVPYYLIVPIKAMNDSGSTPDSKISERKNCCFYSRLACIPKF